jgi:hypothetical protein
VTAKGQLTVLKPGKRCARGTAKIVWSQKGRVNRLAAQLHGLSHRR